MFKSLIAVIASAFLIVPAAAGELQIKDITKGTGEEADVGKTVTVHYTGWLMDGTKFDSSLDRNQPFSFTLGERRVIPGWEQGVVGMKVGGKRELIIPPELGYGARGAGNVIPPNATLKFEVELLAVKGKKFSDLSNEDLKARIAAGGAGHRHPPPGRMETDRCRKRQSPDHVFRFQGTGEPGLRHRTAEGGREPRC